MTQLAPSVSDLIRLGLSCLNIVKAQPERYTVDMDKWHQATVVKDKKTKTETQMPTRVCWAGAVMAVVLQADHKATLGPSDFPEVQGALRALNWFAAGFVTEAFECLGTTTTFANRTIRTDPDGWREDMAALADELENESNAPIGPFFQGRKPHVSQTRPEWAGTTTGMHIPSSVQILPSGHSLVLFTPDAHTLWANLRWALPEEPPQTLVVGCDPSPDPPLWWSGLGATNEGRSTHPSLDQALGLLPPPDDLQAAAKAALKDPRQTLSNLLAQPHSPASKPLPLLTGPVPR